MLINLLKMLKKILWLWIFSLILMLWCGVTTAADGTTTYDTLTQETSNLFQGYGNGNGRIWINTIWTEEDRWWSLIQIIKNAINWVLGMLSLVALVLCLWWWFQIVTAAWDDWKQKKWVSVLKHAAIWLVVIWLSWFVVTIIFWLLRWVTNWWSTTPSST